MSTFYSAAVVELFNKHISHRTSHNLLAEGMNLGSIKVIKSITIHNYVKNYRKKTHLNVFLMPPLKIKSSLEAILRINIYPFQVNPFYFTL